MVPGSCLTAHGISTTCLFPRSYATLCAKRVAKGKMPACVQHCQAHVMEYGALPDLEKRAEQLGRKAVIFRP